MVCIEIPQSVSQEQTLFFCPPTCMAMDQDQVCLGRERDNLDFRTHLDADGFQQHFQRCADQTVPAGFCCESIQERLFLPVLPCEKRQPFESKGSDGTYSPSRSMTPSHAEIASLVADCPAFHLCRLPKFAKERALHEEGVPALLVGDQGLIFLESIINFS
ncbi:MAG: hypothetical protein H7833_14460 [Magnetococcus sp. DMHC-1]